MDSIVSVGIVRPALTPEELEAANAAQQHLCITRSYQRQIIESELLTAKLQKLLTEHLAVNPEAPLAD